MSRARRPAGASLEYARNLTVEQLLERVDRAGSVLFNLAHGDARHHWKPFRHRTTSSTARWLRRGGLDVLTRHVDRALWALDGLAKRLHTRGPRERMAQEATRVAALERAAGLAWSRTPAGARYVARELRKADPPRRLRADVRAEIARRGWLATTGRQQA